MSLLTAPSIPVSAFSTLSQGYYCIVYIWPYSFPVPQNTGHTPWHCSKLIMISLSVSCLSSVSVTLTIITRLFLSPRGCQSFWLLCFCLCQGSTGAHTSAACFQKVAAHLGLCMTSPAANILNYGTHQNPSMKIPLSVFQNYWTDKLRWVLTLALHTVGAQYMFTQGMNE